MDDKIVSVDTVIDGLGGTAEVSRACGVSMSAVSNWRAEGFIPERHHFRIDRLAKKRGLAIPDDFFSSEAA